MADQKAVTSGNRALRGSSWYDASRDARSASRNGIEPAYRDCRCGFRLLSEPGASRVVRGGSQSLEASLCRCAARVGIAPDYRVDNFGFRLTADLK